MHGLRLLRTLPRTVQTSGAHNGYADAVDAISLPGDGVDNLRPPMSQRQEEDEDIHILDESSTDQIVHGQASPILRAPQSPSFCRPALRLQIRVEAASNLPRLHGVGLWSCFCAVRLGTHERRTSVCHGSGNATRGDLGWEDDQSLGFSVFDRSQLLTIRLMSYNGGGEPYVIGTAKIAPRMATACGGQMFGTSEEDTGIEGVAHETRRGLSLLGPNGRILYGRDGMRCRIYLCVSESELVHFCVCVSLFVCLPVCVVRTCVCACVCVSVLFVCMSA